MKKLQKGKNNDEVDVYYHNFQKSQFYYEIKRQFLQKKEFENMLNENLLKKKRTRERLL